MMVKNRKVAWTELLEIQDCEMYIHSSLTYGLKSIESCWCWMYAMLMQKFVASELKWDCSDSQAWLYITSQHLETSVLGFLENDSGYIIFFKKY